MSLPQRPDRGASLEAQVTALKDEIAQLRVHISELKQSLIERDGALAVVDEILIVRRRQVDGLTHELAQREQILETILSSWFWRLTLPRRMVKRASVGVRRILRLEHDQPVSTGAPLTDDVPVS